MRVNTGDDIVEGAAHAGDELAMGRAVQAAHRVLLRRGERHLLPILLKRLVVLLLVVQLVEVASRISEAVERRHARAIERQLGGHRRHV